MASDGQLIILESNLESLLVNAGHFRLQHVTVLCFVNVYFRRNIFHRRRTLLTVLLHLPVLLLRSHVHSNSFPLCFGHLLCQLKAMSICFGLASSVLGNVTVRTPSLYSAFTLSAATAVGSV